MMDTKPHLELISQMISIIGKIELFQTDVHLKDDKESQQKLKEDIEWYNTLRNQLVDLRVNEPIAYNPSSGYKI